MFYLPFLTDEKALMKKLENAFKVVEHTDAMLAYWDKDLVCRFANSAYIKWFGLSPEDMIDKVTLPILLGPLYRQNLPFINKALQGKLAVFEREIQLTNGEIKNTITTYRPDVNQGVTLGFYVHVADVSLVKNTLSPVSEYVEDYSEITIAHNYLNGVEYSLRASLYIGFPGVAALAKKYYVSPTKLKKDFKSRYGATIFSYYRSLQMQVSEKYIQGGLYSNKQLAEMFSFQNPANFSACYKKYRAANAIPGMAAPGKALLIEKQSHGGNPPVSCATAALNPRILLEKFDSLATRFDVLSKCFEHMGIGTWEKNFETSTTNWNSTTKKILEIPNEFEPDITPALHFFKEGPDRDLAKKCLDELFTKGKFFDFQAQLITVMGNEKTVRVLGFCHFEENVCKSMGGTFQHIASAS